MFNTHTELTAFYNQKVKLSKQNQDDMRSKRDTNRDRLDNGLEANASPNKIRNIIQGSYKMHTMVQRPNNDYDIDDGVVFSRKSLEGPFGGDKSALDSRKMVLEALKDARFSKEPKSLKNCVRVFYNEGYHIDVPVYREYEENGETILDLASTDWKKSNPTEISDWFEEKVKEKSPVTDNDQMRRIVCLVKKWAKSRLTWTLPNGLIFSVYAADHYFASAERDDIAFVDFLEAIQSRLRWNRTVLNPVDPDEDFAAGREAKIDKLEQVLDEYLPRLTTTLRDSNCSKNDAMRAWSTFFNDDFFKQYMDEDGGGGGGSRGGLLTSGVPGAAVQKQGQNRYA